MFESLVHRLRPGLLRLAEAITGSSASAEDVVQVTWISVLKSLLTFVGRSSLGTWVHRVCEILGVTQIHQRVLLHRARTHVRWECERFYRGAA